MEQEAKISNISAINPFVILLASLIYSSLLVPTIPSGLIRLISIIPTLYFFYVFPFFFASSLFRGVFSFFISWISSFKLILFCFNQGPLMNSGNPAEFCLITVLPLKVQQNPKSLFTRYQLVRLFNKLHLSTSLQDFWGKRWNRYSSDILKLSVYEPTRKALVGIGAGSGPVARAVALLCTLVVSGVMHELMMYHITCGERPKWKATWFFVVQGLGMVVETELQKLGRTKGWTRVYPAVLYLSSLGFLAVTFYMLLVITVSRLANNECGGFKTRWL